MNRHWFEELMGFKELPYEETQAKLEVVGSTLRSRTNDRCYGIGVLETPSLRELRDQATGVVVDVAGTLRVSSVMGDVGRLHRSPANRHALFQVASQFSLLEMTGPDVSPEDGVTRYAYDRTQGPVCAIAAGAATIYGVVARIVPGPHDAHRQDPHRPMRYDTGRPRAVIRFKISQPRTASLPCPAGLRARRPSPMMDL